MQALHVSCARHSKRRGSGILRFSRTVLGCVLEGLLPLCALATAGCEDTRPSREPSLPPRPAARAWDGGTARRADSGAEGADASSGPDRTLARRALTKLRSEKLDLSQRRVPPQRLAFGSEYLGLLSDSHLVLRKTKTWKETGRIAIDGARQLIALQDGSLLAIGRDATYHLERRAKAPTRHAHVPLFAESVLYADRRQYSGFGVVHAFDARLYRYDLEETAYGLLRIQQRVDLTGFDGRAFAALNDGSFLYTACPDFHRFFPEGKRMQSAAPAPCGDVWRLLLASRLDQVWTVRNGGIVDLVLIGATFRRLRSLELPGSLFDITANAKYLAAVRLQQIPGQPREWWLTVVGLRGKQHLNVKLPTDPAPPVDDWLARFTENKNIALSRKAPLVAVGGPTWLGIWNIKSGEALLTQGSRPKLKASGAAGKP